MMKAPSPLTALVILQFLDLCGTTSKSESKLHGEVKSQLKRIKTLTDEFEALWNGSHDYVFSVELPVAIRNDLIREHSPNSPPTRGRFRACLG